MARVRPGNVLHPLGVWQMKGEAIMSVGRAELAAIVTEVGLALRGSCGLAKDEFVDIDPRTAGRQSLVLLGFTGNRQWMAFEQSLEYQDGARHPLDRWSRRVIGTLAERLDALDVYPNDRPALPFQTLALRCESVHRSPLGLLIDPDYGLWHAYRGALLFRERWSGAPVIPTSSPCESCVGTPCLHGCPVEAFRQDTLIVEDCVRHIDGPAGTSCLTAGCRARLACPVGAEYRYAPRQAAFHMNAFLNACRPKGVS